MDEHMHETAMEPHRMTEEEQREHGKELIDKVAKVCVEHFHWPTMPDGKINNNDRMNCTDDQLRVAATALGSWANILAFAWEERQPQQSFEDVLRMLEAEKPTEESK